MAEIVGPDRKDILEKILKNILGKLQTWVEPQICETVGPYRPHEFVATTSTANELLNKFTTRLMSLPDEDFFSSFDQNGAPKSEVARRTLDSYHNQGIQWGNAIPFWFEGGFGHPDYVADFTYWSRMARLTLEEAVSLTLGVEPKHFSGHLIDELRKYKGDLGPVPAFLVRRHELMRRSFNPHGYDNHVDPTLLANWARIEQIDVHPDFTRYFERYLRQDTAPTAAQTDAFTGDKRQLNSIAKLIAALAIDAYGYPAWRHWSF